MYQVIHQTVGSESREYFDPVTAVKRTKSTMVLKEKIVGTSDSISDAMYLAHCASRGPVCGDNDGDYSPDVYFVREVE